MQMLVGTAIRAVAGNWTSHRVEVKGRTLHGYKSAPKQCVWDILWLLHVVKVYAFFGIACITKRRVA
jgi:hypothetical protein